MISMQNVTKCYGKKNAVNGVTLNISEPGIYGLLGRNGAGKTTLMKLLAGITGASSGELALFGRNIHTGRMPDEVSFIEPETRQFNMRVKDFLRAANGIQPYFDYSFACHMAECFGLDCSKRYKQLSFGMKNMLTALLALANTTPIVLLDEPMLGFDALMRTQFNKLLEESYTEHKRVIVISTHLIDEIANSIQHILVIHEGRLILNAEMSEIDEWAYMLTGPAETVTPLLDGLACFHIKMLPANMLAAYIYDRRIEPPHAVTLERLSLEEFFISLISGIEAGHSFQANNRETNNRHGEFQHE